jgi:hypothetical protein
MIFVPYIIQQIVFDVVNLVIAENCWTTNSTKKCSNVGRKTLDSQPSADNSAPFFFFFVLFCILEWIKNKKKTRIHESEIGRRKEEEKKCNDNINIYIYVVMTKNDSGRKRLLNANVGLSEFDIKILFLFLFILSLVFYDGNLSERSSSTKKIREPKEKKKGRYIWVCACLSICWHSSATKHDSLLLMYTFVFVVS